MIGILLPVLTFLAALGAGLTAGLLFAFSAFVMDALARLPPEQGIAAMQSINVAVLNPLFFTVFFGTAVLCVVLAVAAFLQLGRSRRDLSRCRQSALSRWHHWGDDRAQRAAERRAGGRGAEQCRRCRPVDALHRQLDGLEPCPDGRSPDGIGIVYHRAPIATPTVAGGCLPTRLFWIGSLPCLRHGRKFSSTVARPQTSPAGSRNTAENHRAAVALHFAHYNFVRQHKSLRVSLAKAAGVSDRLWTLSPRDRCENDIK